jgi:probable phosphoglycerate mutase
MSGPEAGEARAAGAARTAETALSATAAPTPPLETRLVLARHGETAWSKSGQHTGRTDIPLTDDGREQARRLGAALAGRTFSRVIASPLSRASETARLAGFGDRMEIDPDLQEWDYGVYEGRRRVDIAIEEPGWTVWSRPIVGGESLDALGARADRVIARLLPVEGDVLIFSHGHFLRVLGARWIEAQPVAASRLELWTATLSELGWEAERRVIEVWNRTP